MLGSHCLNWNPWSLGKQLQQCKISCALTHPAPSPLFSTSLRDVLHQWEQPSVPGRCPARARGSAHMAAGRAHTRTLCSLFPLCCSRESNNFLCKFGNKLLQAGTIQTSVKSLPSLERQWFWETFACLFFSLCAETQNFSIIHNNSF